MEPSLGEQEQRDAQIRRTSEQMAAGSEPAFAVLYHLIFDRLFRLILVQTSGEEELSKEIAQAVLLRLARHSRSFENERMLWAWLRQVSHHCHVDLLRKTRRYRETVNLDLMEYRVPNPEAETDSELFSALDQSLERLEPGEREIVCLAYFEKITHRDIAARLHTSSKAVESKLARTREKLKRMLVEVLKDYVLL